MKNYANEKQIISRYSNGVYNVDVNEIMPNTFILVLHKINVENKSLDFIGSRMLDNEIDVINAVNEYLK